MATNLRVNAATQQAVGAFNALATAIAGARGQFLNLNTAMAAGVTTANNYGAAITATNSAFTNMLQIANSLANGLKLVGAGIQFVAHSLLKELDKLQGFAAIMSVTTKSTDDAAAAYDFLRKTADRLGVQFDALSSNYAKLVAAMPPGVKGMQIAEKAFVGLSMAARTLHSSNADTQLMFYALTQMASKGTVSMEELRRQLGEKLPGVMQIAAKALHTLPEELEKAIRKGSVDSIKFIEVIGDAWVRTFGDSAQRASESVSASLNRLTNVWVDFVKGVIDSGAGQSIVNLFDAIRAKLSDPYVIARFSEVVKSLADQFTAFIKNLTADDIRSGFDTLANGLDMVVKLMGKLISLMTWIINNGEKAGLVVGGLVGASIGMLGGPLGALAGGAAGMAAGGYLGSQLKPSPEQLRVRTIAEAEAQNQKAADTIQQAMIGLHAIVPMLQNFKGLDQNNKELQKLYTADRENTRTLVDLNRILTGKEYKTDKDRANAVLEYAKSGVVLGPDTYTLKDVLGSGASKKTAQEKAEDSTFLKAFGLQGNFMKEFDNLISLYQKGKLNVDQLQAATGRLIDQQPYMIEFTRESEKAQAEYNKHLEQYMDMIFRQVEVKERVRDQLQDELTLAGMRSEQQKVETEVVRLQNQYEQVGLTVDKEKLAVWRDQITARQELQRLTGVGEGILNSTVDRYRPQIDQQKAMKMLMADPSAGFSAKNATDYTVEQDANMHGSGQWLDAQKTKLGEYYSFIDGLRRADTINEETANLAKARAAQAYNEQRKMQTTALFDTLASLSNSGNRRLAMIGKAAAIANATMKAYEAINVALALPFPMNYFQAAAIGLTAFANVRAIASTGYMGGGYTGDMAQNSVAGVVHGQEYVVHAAATARNRSTLDAMNRGATVGGGGVTNVIFNNKVEGVQVRQTGEQETPTGKDLEFAIERIVVGQVQKGGRIADAVEGQYGLNRAASIRR